MTIYPELADDRATGRLTTTLPDGVGLDRVTWGMLTHNAVPGVARVRRTQLDDKVVLTFEAAGEPLARRMETLVRKDDVLRLLDSMVEAVLAADRHMIPTSALVYDAERVFVDAEGGATMLCLPVEGADHGDPVVFFKRVIFNLRYDPQDDASYVSDLINVLGSSAEGDVTRLSRLLRASLVSGTSGRGASAPPVAPTPGAVPGAPAAPVDPRGAASAPAWSAPTPVGADADRTAGPGFAVPGGAPAPAAAPVPARAAAPFDDDEDGDEISLAYLLQHYSKENKERYDRGRRARAAAKAAARATQAGGPEPQGAASGGAVPGGAVPGDAVPGGPVVGGVPQHAAVPTAPFPGGPGFPGQPAAPAPASPPGEGHPGTPWPQAGHAPAAPPAQPQVVADPTATARFGLQDATTGAMTWLTKPITVVGRRRARVDIAVADDTVSKNHAIVQVDGGTCSIIDNASTNGVEVDGERIVPLEPTALRHGSRVRVGEVVLVLVDRATW